MSMFNTGDILETIEMFTQDNLDVRTVTMGISLLDCIDPDPKKACENIYNKITTKAANLVPAVEHISAEYGIPIINKRISVTPIAMLLGACPEADPVDFAKTLDAAGKKVGVNFVGGYSALVHKGFSAGDRRLIESIPRALAETDIVCSSVNIGATKAGLNMDAIKLMGEEYTSNTTMNPSAEDVERVHDLKKQYYAANMDIARKNEALFVILEALRPTHYLAVITTGSRQNATEMLNHFHCTDWFDLILTQEDVVNNKPDPEGYLKAMAHFGVDAAHTMIFEDSATGLAAARATGASVFACNQF